MFIQLTLKMLHNLWRNWHLAHRLDLIQTDGFIACQRRQFLVVVIIEAASRGHAMLLDTGHLWVVCVFDVEVRDKWYMVKRKAQALLRRC